MKIFGIDIGVDVGVNVDIDLGFGGDLIEDVKANNVAVFQRVHLPPLSHDRLTFRNFFFLKFSLFGI